MKGWKKLRSNKAQIWALVDFMAKNKEFAKGELSRGVGVHNEEQWLQLKDILKNYGPDRSTDQWKQTWKDLDRKARQDMGKAVSAAGNSTAVPEVSDLSRKVLDILGHGNSTDMVTEETVIAPVSKQETGTVLSQFPVKQEMDCNEQASSAGNSTTSGKVLDILGHGNSMKVEPEETVIEQAIVTPQDSADKNVRWSRSNNAQIRALVDYMAKNRDFAMRKNPGHFGSLRDERWFQLKEMLKNYGPDRTIEQWKTTWRDLKKKAKQEITASSKAASGTGNTKKVLFVSTMSRKIGHIMGFECTEHRSIQNKIKQDNQDMTNEKHLLEHQIKIERQDTDEDDTESSFQEIKANSSASHESNKSTCFEKPAEMPSKITFLNNKRYTYEYFFQDNICRLCWSTNINNKVIRNNTETAQNILQYVGVNVTTGTIQTVCIPCLDKIDSFIQFKSMCQEADRKLNDLLSITDVPAYHCEVKIEEGERQYKNTQIILEFNQEKDDKNDIVEDSDDDSDANDYYCLSCDKNFDSKERMLEHNKELHSKATRECYGCKRTFSHELKFCDDLKEYCCYGCCKCDLKSSRKRLIDSKEKQDLNVEVVEKLECAVKKKKKVIDKCPVCSVKLESYLEWRQHAVKHRKERRFVCEICGAALKCGASLARHLRVHAGEKIYKCQLCDFRTAHGSSLQSHVKRMHSSERQFKCDRCSYSSVNMASVRRHIKTTHSAIRPHKCKLCNKEFKYRQSLTSHINIAHEGKKDFACKWCGAKYFRFDAMRSHIRVKHKKVIRQVKSDYFVVKGAE